MNEGDNPSTNNSVRNNNNNNNDNNSNNSIPGPTIARMDDNPINANPTNPNFDPWGASPVTDGGIGPAGAEAMWRERERRQRSIRVLMMFLLMLLLMDGEEQQKQRQRRGDYNDSLRKRRKRGTGGDAGDDTLLDPSLFYARRDQDTMVERRTKQHPRYLQLISKNNGRNIDLQVRQWAEQSLELRKDEFPLPENNPEAGRNIDSTGTTTGEASTADPEAEVKIWHYPWNATGFYRGDWSIIDQKTTKTPPNVEGKDDNLDQKIMDEERTKKDVTSPTPSTFKKFNAIEAESKMLKILEIKEDPTIGVHLLPPGIEMELPNLTISEVGNSISDPSGVTSASRRTKSTNQSPFLRGTTPLSSYNTIESPIEKGAKITLSKSSGRAAFQLYSRTVPAMKELSIVGGFVKLYDSNTVGYSTRRDILLRVHGVLIHSIGRISLVANMNSEGRAALVISKIGSLPSSSDDNIKESHEDRRRLEELLQLHLESDNDNVSNEDYLDEIRDSALRLFPVSEQDFSQYQTISSLDDEDGIWPVFLDVTARSNVEHRKLQEAVPDSLLGVDGDGTDRSRTISVKDRLNNRTHTVEYSKYVIPYPFVWDDEARSLQWNRLPGTTRTMPPREQLLEANAGSCEFEINMNVQEEQWTVGQWRNLVSKHMNEASRLDPSRERLSVENDEDKDEDNTSLNGGRNSRKNKRKNGKSTSTSKGQRASLEQALVMTINGTISSTNCDFAANINATAIRTDWEHTTGKAINYSFYMMLTCLTQIVLLLRQLLHTQAQSAATRVSLMCIGWQTVVDALLCLVHIYLSLAMQPLFTAFASVAFFKLLIFCVIEMKYMAIIIQARNASNGGNTIELLRRQIAMLHLRFYVALMAACLGFFYSGETYRTAYMLLLYSFWVPQIVNNVITEAKRPLHPYYVYGISLSRLVAPLYIFAVKNNFLKEVYPESPTNVFMCQLLILWVATQAGILEAQGRYGARFMIPARFLPPKFDYNRPIPSSLLPPGVQSVSPSEELQSERGSPSPEVSLVVPKRDTSPFGVGARNRMKGSKINRAESGMTAETVAAVPKNPSMPRFDCVICYNEIDINNRTGYMLAPCDHLFHKDCLVQWMEVKMECPICRHELPPL